MDNVRMFRSRLSEIGFHAILTVQARRISVLCLSVGLCSDILIFLLAAGARRSRRSTLTLEDHVVSKDVTVSAVCSHADLPGHTVHRFVVSLRTDASWLLLDGQISLVHHRLLNTCLT